MAISLLLYCNNEYFANHLQLMLGEESRKYKLALFSEESVAVDYALKNSKKIHCILATKELIEELGGISSNVALIALDEETVTEKGDTGYYSLNIYQSRKKIMGDIEKILQCAGLLSIKASAMRKTRVISFFSTQGGAGKTTLAYLTACKAAEQGNVAFLDFQPDPCSGYLYRARGQQRAEEALIQIQDRASSETLLSLLYQNEHGVNVLPIPESMLDQATIGSDDLDYLIKGLVGSEAYDFVLIDLGATMGAIERAAMENSDWVAVVYDESKMGAARKSRLEQDPNYHSYPLAGKEIWIANRCIEERKGETQSVRFPVSGSVSKISDIKEVLAGNYAFAQGCEKILAIAKE